MRKHWLSWRIILRKLFHFLQTQNSKANFWKFRFFFSEFHFDFHSFVLQICGKIGEYLWIYSNNEFPLATHCHLRSAYNTSKRISLVNDFENSFYKLITFIFPSVSQNKDTIDVKQIIYLLIKISYSLVSLFMYCECGELLRVRFDELNDDIYTSGWELFPMQIQRLLPIIVINTQQPVLLWGYGGFSCTRETFKRVVNGGYSFFNLVRWTIINGVNNFSLVFLIFVRKSCTLKVDLWGFILHNAFKNRF